MIQCLKESEQSKQIEVDEKDLKSHRLMNLCFLNNYDDDNSNRDEKSNSIYTHSHIYMYIK